MKYAYHFRQWFSYLDKATEECLAFTLFAPYTLGAIWWNGFVDQVADVHYLPRTKWNQLLWKPASLVMRLLIATVQGLCRLTLIPLASGILSLTTRADPPQYEYQVSYYLMRKVSATGTIPLILLAACFAPYLFLTLVLGCIAFCIAVIIKTPQCKTTEDFEKNDLLIKYGFVTDLFVYLYLIYVLAWPLLSYANTLFASSLLALSPAVLGLIVIGISISLYETKTQTFSGLLQSALEIASEWGQTQLCKWGFNPFYNQQDILGTPLQEIPAVKYFIHNDDYVFNLDNLEQNVAARGLENYFLESNPKFDQDNIKRLDKQLSQSEYRDQYPQLKQWLRQRQTPNGAVSAATISQLKALANAILGSLADPSFEDKLIKAKDAFDQHLATLSDVDRKLIENYNVLGGIDEQNQFKNCIDSVLQGNWCKKSAGKLILDMVEQLNHGDLQPKSACPFWRRDTPLHFRG